MINHYDTFIMLVFNTIAREKTSSQCLFLCSPVAIDVFLGVGQVDRHRGTHRLF